MPHWCALHEHHLGKSYHTVVPQCELLQGQPSSPSFHIDHMSFLIGCPLEQWIGCSCWSNTWPANILFSNNLFRQALEQGNCHVQVVAGMFDHGTVRVASLVAPGVDGTSGLHWWFCQHTLQQIQTHHHSTYGRYPVDVKHPCHIQP